MARIVVIGDVGGHADQLRWALSRLGVHSERPVLPDDVIVVQVGDLVDRGPDSAAVLALVREILEHQPEQWIQLAGNHESQYLPGGTRFWLEDLEAADAQLLGSWWERGAMNLAAAVCDAEGDGILLTHAGLTVDCWQDLGEPMTAAGAARLLNERPEVAFRSGAATAGRRAGPLWATAGWELYEPWLAHYAAGGRVPFGQIHGHSAIVRYGDRSWRCPGRVRQRATVDWEARQVRVRVGGRVFTGVDPKHGRHGAPCWQPLVLPDATLLAPLGVVSAAPGSRPVGLHRVTQSLASIARAIGAWQ